MHAFSDPQRVFERYEAIRPRLPEAPREGAARPVEDLSQVFEDFDVFVLDGFGVLNVGGAPVPGATERVAAMRAAGKTVIVLTNAATLPRMRSVEKYAGLGFDFAAEEIVSSRDVAMAAMASYAPETLWGATAAGTASLDGLRASALADAPEPYEEADAFLYLSADAWSERRQERLAEALAARARPVVVANPDLVAPREEGLTMEPGAYAHRLLDDDPGLSVAFYGKPFGNAFQAVEALLDMTALDRRRIAMVGDTLHTDVLGALAAGWSAILITAHGVFKGLDVAPYIDASRIVPDVVARTT